MKTKKTTLQKPSKTGDTSPAQSPASPQCVRWADLDKWEQTSVVCGLFTKGKKFSEIAQTINQIYHANLKRESTYPILLNAIRHKWIRYVPPLERTLEGQLKEKYPWLDGVYCTFLPIQRCGLLRCRNPDHPFKTVSLSKQGRSTHWICRRSRDA